MNQRQLDREVSKKTGETVSTIAALGFVPLTASPYEREPFTIDWDDLDAERNRAARPQRARTARCLGHASPDEVGHSCSPDDDSSD